MNIRDKRLLKNQRQNFFYYFLLFLVHQALLFQKKHQAKEKKPTSFTHSLIVHYRTQLCAHGVVVKLKNKINQVSRVHYEETDRSAAGLFIHAKTTWISAHSCRNKHRRAQSHIRQY